MLLKDAGLAAGPTSQTLGVQRFANWLRRCAVRNQRLHLCETLQLGGRRSVALIECDGRRYLAGLSATGVHTLLPVADGESSLGEGL